MAMVQFKAGDVVCLRSGGPDMTIEFVESGLDAEYPRVSCVWFDGKTLNRTTLPLSALHAAIWPIAA